MNVGNVLLLIVASLLGYGGALAVKTYAARLNLVDKPNHRSSHVKSTPRGGGLGIVLGGTVTGGWLVLFQSSDVLLWTSLIFLSIIIAILGIVDDARNVSAKIRFVVQLVSVGALLFALGELPDLPLPFGVSVSGLMLFLLISLAAIWWINLFNFMDGIDGIAGAQALFMLVAAAGLSFTNHSGEVIQPLFWWMLYLAAASLGFLLLNWPPAKIFMGDVGSTYLGFMIVALALLSVQAGTLNYAVWLILAAVFLTDATVTLLTRLLHGERIYQAHRNHTYQRLALRWGRHSSVTVLFTGINMIWLLPLAWSCAVWPEWSWGYVFVAYVPLIFAAVILKAGRQNERSTAVRCIE